jgi:uncharacterized membrane protein
VTELGTPTPEGEYRPRLPDAAYRRTAVVLRIGLATSLAILVSALVAYLAQDPTLTLTSTLSSNPIGPYLTAAGLSRGLTSAQPAAFLTLGIYVFIATPVARVATGMYYFERGRERTMALVTFSVLVLLLLGLFVIGPLIR